MKRLLKFNNVNLFAIAGLFAATLFLGACKKDNAGDNVRTPAAGLMAFNLTADKASVGYTLSGNSLTNAPLGYNNYTGAYLPVFTGSREVRTFDFATGSTLAITNNEFKDSLYYSAFLLGNNGNYRNVVMNDNIDSLNSFTGKAWVRYINAIPDSSVNPIITIGAGGEDVINESAAYAKVSDFKLVSAGPVNTAVNNGGTISANRVITLEQNKIYTVLFTGLPDQTDSTKAVQIRFISNGTITP